MKKAKITVDLFIVLFIGTVSLTTYWWTVDLPVIGDGLMHLSDTTDLSSVGNLIKVFYTFEGVGKPEVSYTRGLHRPVFNEIIVTLTKIITNSDVRQIRIVSVFAFSLVVICSYILGKELFQSRTKAILFASLMNFSIIYYSGIYEYGLSFSIWLTLFVIIAFYFTIRYIRYDHKIVELFFSIVFTLLAIYTKESAMCLGIALSWYVFINEFSKNKKITFKVWLYSTVQLIVLFIYFYTRYLKLGSLFTAATVDAGKITFIDSIQKIYGYYLLSYNIPNSVIPDYMCARSTGPSIVISFLLFLFAVYIAVKSIYTIFKSKQYRYDIIAFSGMYLFLLTPVFKVNRNAPYYGDICVFCVFSVILTLCKFESKKKYVIILIILLFTGAGISNMYVSTQEGRHYLSVQSNEAKNLKDQLQNIKADINKNEVILMTNWAKNSDSMFIYNHNKNGSFYKYNIDPSKNVDLVSAKNIHDDASFVDYYKNINTNEIEIFVYPHENTKIALATYGLENRIIEIGFSYNGSYYHSTIDIESKKKWSDDNCIYCVIPKECALDVVGSNCSVTYPRGE